MDIAIANERDGAFGRIADIVEAGGILPGRLICTCVKLIDAEYIVSAVTSFNIMESLAHQCEACAAYPCKCE